MSFLRKILVIVLVIFLVGMIAIVLDGRESSGVYAEKRFDKDEIRPLMKQLENEQYKADGTYYYTVDERTGAVYIEYDGFNRHAMTVAYNADGTVMTKEQIEKYK